MVLLLIDTVYGVSFGLLIGVFTEILRQRNAISGVIIPALLFFSMFYLTLMLAIYLEPDILLIEPIDGVIMSMAFMVGLETGAHFTELIWAERTMKRRWSIE